MGKTKPGAPKYAYFSFLTLLLFFLQVALPVWGSDLDLSNDQARESWMKAYHKLEQAEKIEGRRNYAEALELFRQAKIMFEQVRQTYPHWNPSILQYRVNYCEKKIGRLSPRAGQGTQTRQPINQSELSALKRKLRVANVKLAEQQTSLLRLNRSLNKARSEAARSSQALEQVERLSQENHTLRESAESARRDVHALSAELIQLKQKGGLDKALLALHQQQELARLKQAKYEQKKQQLQDEAAQLQAKTKALSLELAQAQEEQKQTRQQIAPLQEANRQFTRQLEEEKKKTDQARLQFLQQKAHLDATLQELTDSRKKLAAQVAAMTALQQKYAAIQQERLHLLQQKEELEQQNAELKTATENARTEAQASREAQQQTEQEALAIQAQFEQLQKKISAVKSLPAESKKQTIAQQAVQADIRRLTSEKQKQAVLLQQAKEKIEALNARLVQKRNTETHALNEARKLIASLQQEQEKQIQQVRQKQKIMAQQKQQLTALRAENETVKQTVKQQERELDLLQQANFRIRQALAEATARLAKKDADASSQNVASKELRLRYEKIKKENQKLTEQNAAHLAMERALDQELNRLQEKIKKQEIELTKARKTGARGRADTLTGYRTLIRDLKSKVDKQKKKIDQLQNSLIAKNVQPMKPPALGSAPADRHAGQTTDILEAHIRKLIRALEQERIRNTRLQQQLDHVASGKTAAVSSPTQNRRVGLEPKTEREIDHEAALARMLNQATAAERQKNRQAAIWQYQKILEMDPHSTQALVHLGNLLTDAGDFSSAERYLMRAFYDNPDNMDVLHPLGFVLAHEGKANMAVSMLTRAIALAPDNADFYRYLGVACRSLGWTQVAEKSFLQSFHYDKKNSDTAFNLAILYLTTKPPRLAEARKWYQEARTLGAQPDPGVERLLFEKHTKE